jgi:IS6 family transposase
VSVFKRRRFPVEVILLCVRWYCKYGISDRDLAEMMQERGVMVDHLTIFRWVQRYAPEIDKRFAGIRVNARRPGGSMKTYVRVGDAWKYLFRAVDRTGLLTGWRVAARAYNAVTKPSTLTNWVTQTPVRSCR